MSIRSIAKETGMSRNSVRKYLRNEPVKKHAQKRASKLDPYRDTIRILIEKHNLSAVRIMEEIRKKGYDGGYSFTDFWTNSEKNYETVPAISPPFLLSIFFSLRNSFAFSIFASLTARRTSGSPL